MAYGDTDMEDVESLGNRLTGAIDALADLISGQTMEGVYAKANDLSCLMRLIAAEAHNLHDIKFGPRPPRANND